MLAKFTVVSALLFAGAAVASPTERRNAGNVGNQCGNGGKGVVACCNSGGLLGLNCVAVPILSIPISNSCSADQTVSCCQTNQVGLINVNAECIPILS